MQKKSERGTLQSRPVLYVTRKKREKPLLFSPMCQQLQFGALKFCSIFYRTIWVTSGVSKKKTLTKSHDNSRLFSCEKRRLRTKFAAFETKMQRIKEQLDQCDFAIQQFNK